MVELANKTLLPSMPKSEYVYSPLNDQANEIRLVNLMRGAIDNPVIRCSIQSVPLNDKISYEALSYTWGDEGKISTIDLDEQNAFVTPNLKSALVHLRKVHSDRILWIDSLCINQADYQEVNMQVRMMDKIYTNAERVVVWLGEEADNSGMALEVLRELQANDFSSSWIRKAIEDRSRVDHFTAIGGLFIRPYWFRLWVVQEVAFARDAVVQCGTMDIPYNSFQRFKIAFDDAYKSIEDPEFALKMFNFKENLKVAGPGSMLGESEGRTEAPRSLLYVLDRLRIKVCSNPRDKIYGLLALSDLRSSANPGLCVDYSLPVATVYTHVVRAVIEETQRLNILCSSEPGASPSHLTRHTRVRQIDLPSWVPDWNFLAWPQRLSRTKEESNPGAAGHTVADATFSSNGKVLTVKGYFIGTVSTCGNPCNGPPREEVVSGSSNYFSRVTECIGRWRVLALNRFHLVEAAEDAFYNTLLAGTWSLTPVMLTWLRGWWAHWHSIWGKQPRQQITIDKAQEVFLSAVQAITQGRRFFLCGMKGDNAINPGFASFGASMGLGLETVQTGDSICVLLGCDFPIILRRNQDFYTLVGEAFIYNCMDGQCLDGRFELRSFVIH